MKKFRLPLFFILFLSLILFTIPFILPAPAHAALTDGLVGYWTFDGKDTMLK